MQECMGERVRVVLKDKRVYEGTLHCVDSKANVIVADGCEVFPLQEGEELERRGRAHMLLIADKFLESISIERDIHDRTLGKAADS